MVRTACRCSMTRRRRYASLRPGSRTFTASASRLLQSPGSPGYACTTATTSPDGPIVLPNYVDVVEEDYSWASDLASALFPALEPLLQGPTTVVSRRVLSEQRSRVRRSHISGRLGDRGLGAGELDLASLIDNWPAAICEVALDIYAETRWGNAEQPGFRDRIELARVYQDLRWLGDRRERTAAPNEQRRFASLHDRAVRLGVL